jgi:hypothetical protein
MPDQVCQWPKKASNYKSKSLVYKKKLWTRNHRLGTKERTTDYGL